MTLVELLIAVTVIGILVAVAIPSLDPTKIDQLTSAAQLVQSDLAYGRSLAISHASRYKFTFDVPGSAYVLQHAGTNSAFDDLPEFPYKSASDTSKTQTTSLSALPFLLDPVRLVAVQNVTSKGVVRSTTAVEFGSYGETTEADATRIWLGTGTGSSSIYVSVDVNPTTGLSMFGGLTRTAPGLTGPGKLPFADMEIDPQLDLESDE